MKRLLWPVLVSGALLAPAAFAQEPLPPECQGMQEELDARIEMQSLDYVAPTNPAYLAWLQQQIDACKRKQSGSVDESRNVDTSGNDGVPRKKFPTGAIPSHIDWSHLQDNPPHYLVPDSVKDGRDKNKADDPPPTSWDMRSRNWLPPVRNQNPFDTCWAFAALGSAESNAISQGFDNLIIQRYA